MKITLAINKVDDFKKILLKGFVFLGPLGNLLTPQLFSHAFRTYYLILMFFPVFFISPWQRMWKIFLCFFPFFLYSLIFIDGSSIKEAYLKWFLLWSQFVFVVGAGFSINSRQEKVELIFLYLKSFFVSLLLGYLFFIGYYSSVISYNWVERFSILTQMGYGFLRFGPGSYPNEYGIVTSFVLSILTLLICRSDVLSFSKRFIYFFYVLALVALLLTTTRAAYLSYIFTLFYIAVKSRKFVRILMMSVLSINVVILFLSLVGVNIWNVLSIGFSISSLEGGSLGERLSIWGEARGLFMENPWLGEGFSSWGHAHNVYLQLLVECGLLGSCLLLSGIVLSLLAKGYWVFRRAHRLWQGSFYQNVVAIGLMHVLWFAISNHNLNHHMTWFILLLCLKNDSQERSSI